MFSIWGYRIFQPALYHIWSDKIQASVELIAFTLIIAALVSNDWKVGLFGSAGLSVPILSRYLIDLTVVETKI